MRGSLTFVAWVLGIAGLVLGVLYYFVVDVWTLPIDDPLLAASVAPTLAAGDVVVITRRGAVERGHLLRCADPQAPGRFIVARAIGRYGDSVDITREIVSIDGRRTPSPRRCDPPRSTVFDPTRNTEVELDCAEEEYAGRNFSALRDSESPMPVTKASVEQGKWFLVSDDRHIHLDSRDYGQVEPSTCQHILFRIVGPAGFTDARSRLTVIW
ncbi:MAG TPA: S26 family signal peptidase [Polyangiaceae bacterium]|jgi:signal peptidase I|nr:S26 family signal peptidase [Polyangiaceae bacterium]